MLKDAPVVSDEIECVACDANLAELVELNEKYMVRIEEVDLLSAQLKELRSRSALLGACTSCPVLHAKLNDALARAKSPETALKSPIANTCSSCDVVALKNDELEHYVNRLQDENDNLRKCLGWVSAHEPQLGMMIAKFKRADGHGLGSEEIGECSGEKRDEEAGAESSDIPEPIKKPPTKNTWQPKPNHLLSKLDTTPDPPKFPPKTNNFQKRVIFVRSEDPKPSEKPQLKETPKPRPARFHCEHCGRDGHIVEYSWRKKREVRREKELGNRDRYYSSRSVPEPRRPLPRGEASVRTVPSRGERSFTAQGAGSRFGGSARGEFARRPPFRGQSGGGRFDRSFEARSEFRPRFPPRDARVQPVRRERVPWMGSRNVDFANPSFEQMARHCFNSFCSNPSVKSSAHSFSRF